MKASLCFISSFWRKKDGNFRYSRSCGCRHDADYGNDREQSRQLLNGMLVRLEGVEGVVEKQGVDHSGRTE